MTNHFDSQISYTTDVSSKSLYKWCLRELDSEGRLVGGDWIPWKWSLYFKANHIMLEERWTASSLHSFEHNSEITNERYIKVNLAPDNPPLFGNRIHDLPPWYSILGTKRNINLFDLYIREVESEKEERCEIFGHVSDTSEIDFINVTTEDYFAIYLLVKSNTFDRYAQMIESNHFDKITFVIKDVSGFYSHWSPSITTDGIKVLTGNVNDVPDEGFNLPRLGNVGEAQLWFARKQEFPLSTPADTDLAHSGQDELYSPARQETIEADAGRDDPHSENAALLTIAREERATEVVEQIHSLKIAVWLVAAILLIQLFKQI